MTELRTVTVRYQPYRYSGWRRWWRRLTLRPVESDVYEFLAIPPGTTWETDEEICTTFSFRPVGPVRKVKP